MKEKPKKLDVRGHPAPKTPEEQLQYMTWLATKRAEQQLIDGTASAQVITHYLKLASPRERLEEDLIRKQQTFVEAKTEQLHSSKEMKELYQNAIKAMQRYSGQDDDDDEDVQ